MSSILEALKKLERERALPHQKEKTFDITPEILQDSDGPRPERRIKSWRGPVWAGAGVVLCLLVGGGVFWRYQTSPPPMAGTSPPTAEPARDYSAESLPPAAAGVSRPAPAKAVSAMGAEGTGSTPGAEMAGLPSKKPEAIQRPAATGKTIPTAAQSQAVRPGSASVRTSGVPSLKLIGIAFEEGKGNALVIINHRTLTEGESILGARVEKIFSDKVYLSWQGKTIELVMGKSAR
ncbi:MAG: hypothetical protein GX751_09345 [Desulfuromonadaceae bacterium]|nr:hypothetical protein [Desulfuromonadaceae bacterium]